MSVPRGKGLRRRMRSESQAGLNAGWVYYASGLPLCNYWWYDSLSVFFIPSGISNLFCRQQVL